MKASNIKKISLFLAVIICICSPYQSMFKEWWEESDLLELTSDNFDAQVKSNQLTVVEFYTKWCKYCKKLSPILDELVKVAEKISTPDIKVTIARLNAEAHQSTAILYNVFRYPTVICFHQGKGLSVYEGGHEVNMLKFWIQRSMPYYKKPRLTKPKEDAGNLEDVDTPEITKKTRSKYISKLSTYDKGQHESDPKISKHKGHDDKQTQQNTEAMRKELEAVEYQLDILEKEIKNLSTAHTKKSHLKMQIILIIVVLILLVGGFLLYRRIKKKVKLNYHSN